ncbi:MAG TPA: peptidoglycan DD-metalloendopeptidase family protein [Sandaracinaceae bacterium LLY-WYZ-13_1]|nr:peptidoglycan DD-metalloendopeptidase family protein [Sandaracinaceae bacterium LLY-WYZ-13_1]
MPRSHVLRALSWLLAGLAAVIATADALALTEPLTGATLYPTSGPPLRLPFPAGTNVYVLSSYGPSNGSSLHRNLTDPSHGNDHYALDLTYADDPDHGLGMPIVAAIPGEVVKAGWATAGWANFGQRVILRHDLGDGHTYYSLYAHLDSIAPGIEEGVTVGQGQVVGALGASCQGELSCSSFSTPHLHWSIHRDSMIGGTGTGGSYGGNAVVPEPIDGHEDLFRGQELLSMNTGAASCGDGFCSGDETHEGCPGDCPICEPIPSAGRTVDEAELCFTRGGDPRWWNEAEDGWDGGLVWTHTTDADAVDNHGIWELSFEEAGEYRVEVYTNADFAQAQRAAYAVTHDGMTDRAVLDQSAADGWQTLGTYRFAAGGGQEVRLDDNTGEAYTLRRQIVFDAIRLVRTDAPSGPDAGPATPDGGVPVSDGGDDSVGEAGRSDGGSERPELEGGCAVGPGGAAPGPWLLLGLGWWLARRRRRRGSGGSTRA